MSKEEQDKLEKLIREYLDKGALMQVATCRDNQPWTCNVWYSYDDDFNFYFISGNYRRHSEEIRDNEKVAVAIVQPIFTKLGQLGRGITFEGTAKELNILSSGKAFDNYLKKWPKATMYISKKDIRNNLTKTRFYKITPKMIVLFDEVNYPDQSRREFHLK
ncbi:MAG: pyridoxamine 5'-phosphate oxidase family protein [Patescibacteria group bacterium]